MSEPTLPVLERIALAIKAVLEGITQANGYLIDIAGVLRPKRIGLDASPTHLQCVMLQIATRPADSPTSGADEYETDFGIDMAIRVTDDDPTAFDTYANLGEVEIGRAMLAEPRTLGGLCLNMRMDPADRVKAAGGLYEGIGTVLTVEWRCQSGNMSKLLGE